MAEICLVLHLDSALITALDELVEVEHAELNSRNAAAISILRHWLTATGYLDEDKPLRFPTDVDLDRG